MADNKLEAKKADVKKPAKKSKKPNVFKRLIKYLGACKGELKKITWPTAKTTANHCNSQLRNSK